MNDTQDLLASVVLVILVVNILILLLYSLLSSSEKVRKSRLKLPVYFAEVRGNLMIIGESLAFIDNARTELSFAIDRDNIIDLSQNDTVLHIKTKEPSGNNLVRNSELVFRITDKKNLYVAKWLQEVRDSFPTKI